jgi:hypothetical protein
MSFLPFISDCASNNRPAGSLQSLRQKSILAKVVYMKLGSWRETRGGALHLDNCVVLSDSTDERSG